MTAKTEEVKAKGSLCCKTHEYYINWDKISYIQIKNNKIGLSRKSMKQNRKQGNESSSK